MAKDCENVCEGCEGEPKKVIVYGVGFKPTEFEYCNKAIKSDRLKGFTVEVIGSGSSMGAKNNKSKHLK